MELIVVMLVAMLVLGPSRMVETARTVGKFWRQAQTALRELADEATITLDVDDDEEDESEATAALPEPSDSVSRPSSSNGNGASNGHLAEDDAEEARRHG